MRYPFELEPQIMHYIIDRFKMCRYTNAGAA